MNDKLPDKIEKFAAQLMAFTDPARVYRLKKKPGPDEIVYAGFNDRAFAGVIDAGLCIFLFYQPFYAIARMLFGHERAMQFYSLAGLAMTQEQQLAMVSSPGYFTDYILNSIMQMAVIGAVYIVVWSYSSATPGKWLLRMRIVDARTGCRPTQRQFIIRFFAAILSFLPLTLGFLWIAFDEKKQGWHDKLAGTVVVKVKHWRLTPPDVSEYPEAALAAMAAEAEEEEEEEEDTEDKAEKEEETAKFAVVSMPEDEPVEDEKDVPSGKQDA